MHNNIQEFAVTIISKMVKRTANRASFKNWESEIFNEAMEILGYTNWTRKYKCEHCKGVLVVPAGQGYAVCVECLRTWPQYRTVKSSCGRCNKVHERGCWDEEESRLWDASLHAGYYCDCRG